MISDEDIKRIIMRTIEYEGTEYEDVPGDSGGGTKFGVSQNAYQNLDIANLTLEDAVQIYVNDYFNKIRLAEVDDVDIAGELFDTAVNMGRGGVMYVLRQALWFLGEQVEINTSGMDDYTLSLVNKWCAKDTRAFFKVLNGCQFMRYFNNVAKRPESAKFARGWMKRIQQVG